MVGPTVVVHGNPSPSSADEDASAAVARFRCVVTCRARTHRKRRSPRVEGCLS
ncbi:hypothetical protein GA0115239_103335 [Streptomyces sp. BpilaLS-43]|nr:hypothetical protein GA0115239_103335 [Streptomyces sp. BpilaLS-43]